MVATTGIRALTEEELKAATSNESELREAESYATTRAEAAQFAAKGKLVARELDYLPLGFSVEEEVAIGRQAAGNLLGAAPLVKDAKLQKYVNNVGRWVASQSERETPVQDAPASG